MNAAVRAVVRMGIYLGCKVYFIKEGYQGMNKIDVLFIFFRFLLLAYCLFANFLNTCFTIVKNSLKYDIILRIKYPLSNRENTTKKNCIIVLFQHHTPRNYYYFVTSFYPIRGHWSI